MKSIRCKFHLWQAVRLLHDPAKEHRMVAQVSVGGTGTRYNLVCGDKDTWHYEMEIEAVEEKKVGFKIGFE